MEQPLDIQLTFFFQMFVSQGHVVESISGLSMLKTEKRPPYLDRIITSGERNTIDDVDKLFLWSCKRGLEKVAGDFLYNVCGVRSFLSQSLVKHWKSLQEFVVSRKICGFP